MKARLLVAGLLLTLSPSARAGTISFTSTPYPDSVVLDITVEDTGDEPSCLWIVITSDGAPKFYIERQFGTTTSYHFVDTDVSPNMLYCYEGQLRPIREFPFFCGYFCDAFDCLNAILGCGSTGPDLPLLGHGYLRSRFIDGTPVDGNKTKAVLHRCIGYGNQMALHSIPLEAEPYVDTDTALDVYGTYWCCWDLEDWLLVAEVVEPHACAVAVEETTWGRVKSLYRD